MIQKNASVVVLIVNWNGIEDTIECVNSICDSNFKDFELYIIDNNSQESDSKTLKKQFGSNDKICLRFYDKNYGFTKAHIKIFKEELITKKFEWLLLLNNDVTIDINCISNLISHANTNHLDITSSKMINYFKRSEMDNAGHRVISTGEIIPIGSGQNVDEFDENFVNLGACAGGALYKKSCVSQIGFFDDYFNTGYEDAELGLRAFLTGFKTGYCASALVYHKGGKSIKKVFNEGYAIQNQKNILFTIIKLYPLPLLLLYYPINIFRSILIIIICLLIYKWNISKIMFKAIINFHFKDFKIALIARNKFQGSSKTIPWYKLFLQLHSFVKFDIERAWEYLIKRSPSALDKYR